MLLWFFAMVTLAVVIYSVQRAVRGEPVKPGAKVGVDRPPRPPGDEIERALTVGAAPSARFRIDNQRSPYMNALLGPGTPDFGPAPPEVDYEPDENVLSVDDLGTAAAQRFVDLGEE